MHDVRPDFPIFQREPGGRRIVYLDSAATSLKPQTVIDAVTRFYTTYTAGVHRAVHQLAEEATEEFEGARIRIAQFFHVDSKEVVFTRGATSAIQPRAPCLSESAADCSNGDGTPQQSFAMGISRAWQDHPGRFRGKCRSWGTRRCFGRGPGPGGGHASSNVLGCQPAIEEIVSST